MVKIEFISNKIEFLVIPLFKSDNNIINVRLDKGEFVYSDNTDKGNNYLRVYEKKGFIKVSKENKPEYSDYFVAYNQNSLIEAIKNNKEEEIKRKQALPKTNLEKAKDILKNLKNIEIDEANKKEETKVHGINAQEILDAELTIDLNKSFPEFMQDKEMINKLEKELERDLNFIVGKNNNEETKKEIKDVVFNTLQKNENIIENNEKIEEPTQNNEETDIEQLDEIKQQIEKLKKEKELKQKENIKKEKLNKIDEKIEKARKNAEKYMEKDKQQE